MICCRRQPAPRVSVAKLNSVQGKESFHVGKVRQNLSFSHINFTDTWENLCIQVRESSKLHVVLLLLLLMLAIFESFWHLFIAFQLFYSEFPLVHINKSNEEQWSFFFFEKGKKILTWHQPCLSVTFLPFSTMSPWIWACGEQISPHAHSHTLSPQEGAFPNVERYAESQQMGEENW